MEGDVTAEAPAIPNSNTNSNNHHVLQETPIKIDREEVLKEDKLNIELPKGVKEEDVQIVNDYMNNTVYVRFAKAVDDYSEKYMVRGSSDHIANLSYYKEETEGVLEIKLDKACEHFYDYKDGFLRMELKDLREVYDKIVVIDAGHGDTHPGATKKDICEKDLNLDIVLALKALLDEPEQKKVKALYTRLEDINPSLEERADMANKMEADLFISVHNNSSTDGKFSSLNGTMVLYSQKQSADESKRFAQICLENVIESIGSENLGLVKGDDIYIIRSSHVPVALIEVGYMTNVEELEKLCDEEYQKKVAQGIYDAMMQAFEEGF
jgi:N-acetylmuramoyl-L-alanine amidase